MNKEHKNSREDKKKPLLTQKERRTAKRDKKTSRAVTVGELKR
ncbi:MAG: hypothetical protein U5P41_15795 [Gammaproteobacteria bacterium]|nr:hypothetical protein [Gammaproteobacteria bacterium]